MTLTRTTAHVAEALENLLEQFKSSTRLQALLTAYVEQVQDIEDAAFDLFENRWLATAEGIQLDVLGVLIGEPRQDRSDSDYRLYLEARILANKSNGTPEEIVEIIETLSASSGSEFVELFPAAFTIWTDKVLSGNEPTWWAKFVQDAKPAAVHAALRYGESAKASLFEYDGAVDWSGSHTGANNVATLTDSTKSWGVDALVGDIIWNTTDGSRAKITANTATTITATLDGGTENDWDTGDTYEVQSGTGYDVGKWSGAK